jgi:hypothetical protein
MFWCSKKCSTLNLSVGFEKYGRESMGSLKLSCAVIVLLLATSCKSAKDTSVVKDIIGPAGSVFRVTNALPFASHLRGTLTAALSGSGKELCAGLGSLNGVDGSIGLWFKSGATCERNGAVLDSSIVAVVKRENILPNPDNAPKYLSVEFVDLGSWTNNSQHIVALCNSLLSTSCDLDLTGAVPKIVPKTI